MATLDRYILRHFLRAYLACLLVLLCLYVVVDLFSKMHEFADGAAKFKTVLDRVRVYYQYRLPWFFDRFHGVFGLLAALFTWAWLERQNEITPWLAAGVPARRLVAPLMVGVFCTIGLSLANREYLVPRCAAGLQRGPGDPGGRQGLAVRGGFDHNLIHFEGRVAWADRQMVQDGRITLPAHVVGKIVRLRCVEMFYRPPGAGGGSGWYLMAAEPERLETYHPAVDFLGPGTYFLHSDMSFERLTRPANWYRYQPTHQLLKLAWKDEPVTHRAALTALVHRRLTTPLLDIILVLLGVGLMAGRSERGFFWKIGLGLLAYFGFELSLTVCHHLAENGYVSAALAAWLPVFVYGPASLALLDGLRT